MRKKRKLETSEERGQRLKTGAEERRDADAQEGDDLDDMVRKSIKRHGP